jgi:tetratricopeptide (TPR) repeat protein
LNALQEEDARGVRAAIAEMSRFARATGVRWLSGYSRTALNQARGAERAGRKVGAALAYDAAVALDGSSFDAAASRVGFFVRSGRIRDAVKTAPAAIGTMFASAESRLSFASSLAILFAVALVAAAVATALGLFLKHFRRMSHDIREIAGRPFGDRAATPLAFVVLALPFLLSFGPVWLLLYWAALAYGYSDRRERVAIASALLVFGLAPLAVDVVARENLLRRSPIYLAAVDLAERREDSGVEDGLAALAAAYPDQPDSWFLLARYAERAGDNPRALAAYGRAIQADPKDYRPFVNRGNVRFLEGEHTQAISDYEEAGRIAPHTAEAFYNLAVARSEIYDFKGQERARARALQISRRDVDAWSSHPTLSRVVPAAYPLSSARESVRTWSERTSGPASRLDSRSLLELVLSPWCLAPWGALLFAWMLAAALSRIGFATECSRCGRPFCRRCKRYGGPPLYCERCVRLYTRGGETPPEVRTADRRETARRRSRRRAVVRVASFFAPGVHRFFAGRPYTAVAMFLPFFFAVGIAVDGPWLFELAPLAPPAVPARLAAGAAALTLSLVAVAGAWRQTREP